MTVRLIQLFISLIVLFLGSHSLSLSSRSIPKLSRGDTLQQASKWSNMAERKLWETRDAVVAGFLTVMLSTLGGLVLMLVKPSRAGPPVSGLPALASVLYVLASLYMGSFWKKRAKIPLALADTYNDAISENIRIKTASDGLAVAWGAIAMIELVTL